MNNYGNASGETQPDTGVRNTTAAVIMRNDQILNLSFREECY